MTSLDLTLEDIELDLKFEGWIYTSRKDRIYHPVADSLKEVNKSAYRHWKRLCRTAIWKTRKAKFERYANNLINYFKKDEEKQEA